MFLIFWRKNLTILIVYGKCETLYGKNTNIGRNLYFVMPKTGLAPILSLSVNYGVAIY